MWTDSKVEGGSLCRRGFNYLLLFTGDMTSLDDYIKDKLCALQLVVWVLRGVSRVAYANNPLTGALILAALYWESPWQCLLGTLGVLTSTITAVVLGQDRTEVSEGNHGYNGMLVPLLIGVLSSAGDWYWWLLLPSCLGSATCVFFYSCLSSVVDRWDVPVGVFPFNITVTLYLLCTGPDNPYFPHHRTLPLGLWEPNGTQLAVLEVIRGSAVGVGQIFVCEALGPSLLVVGALLVYSPLLAFHALLGSGVGALAALSVAVHHDFLYSGLSGLNGALSCMAIGGLFFTLNWRTHLFAISNAFLCVYVDIALQNLLGVVGLPASSWASTFTTPLMMLMTGALSSYRVPSAQATAPKCDPRCCRHWEDVHTTAAQNADV